MLSRRALAVRCRGAASPSSGRVNALRGIFVAPDSNVVSPLAIALFSRDQVRIALGEFLAAIRVTLHDRSYLTIRAAPTACILNEKETLVIDVNGGLLVANGTRILRTRIR